MKRLINGVHAMQTEDYQLSIQSEYTLQKTDRAALLVKSIHIIQIRKGHFPNQKTARLRNLHRKPQSPGVHIL